MENGDNQIYEYADGQFHLIGKPKGPTDRENFLITCKYGDWSGFRTLSDCEFQLSSLAPREDDFYQVVERF